MRYHHLSCRIILTATLVAVGFTPVRAHEEGVLNVAASSVEAGTSLGVSGERFSPATTYALVLKGPLDEYRLGEIETDAEGRFVAKPAVPAAVRPGVYRLVAMAPDGDDAAEVDVTVTAAAEAVPGEGEDISQRPVSTRTPRAGELTIERSWTGVEWFVIGTLLGGALAAGAALYRRSWAH